MNRLCTRLSKGDGNIAGMKMLLPVKNTALAEVEVVGIAFGHSCRDGVAVMVRPIHGAGEASVDATDLLDNTKVSRELYFRKAEAQRFVDGNELRNNSDRNWRSLVLRERGKLTSEQLTCFDARANKLLGGKAIAKSSAYEIRPLWSELVDIKFDLKGDVPYIRSY